MSFTRSIYKIVILLGFIVALGVYADEISSTNFTVTDSTVFSSATGASASFGLTGVVSQPGIGISTSTTFGVNPNFLYFPYIVTPVLTATGIDSQVALTWTSADASVGWAVGGYYLGTSTVSGGPYRYMSVGTTLSSVVSGLTNGTPYYFVIRVLDSLGNFIATSTQIASTPTVLGPGGTPTPTPDPTTTPTPTPASGGGGGGGGGSTSTVSPSTGSGGINFSGRAYPRSAIVILKDAQVVTTTVADSAADFKVSLLGLTPGNYFFSVYSEDDKGRRSNPITFPVSVTLGAVTDITGIFITPTIAVDKSQVKKGDTLAIFGQTTAKSDVTIQVNSEETLFAKTKADAGGVYLYNFDTAPLEYGDHSTKSKASLNNEISSFSPVVAFKVGTQNIAATVTTSKCTKKGDQNGDCKVNLVDYSIIAYWYKRLNVPLKVDLNGDGKVNLVDFSILAYNWTG